MKRFAIILTAIAASVGATCAQGNFIAAGGSAPGCTFAIESAVSGSTSFADGSVLSHGSMPLVCLSTDALLDLMADAEDGPALIFTLDGRSVNSDIENLEPGIYIVCKGSGTYKYIQPAR